MKTDISKSADGPEIRPTFIQMQSPTGAAPFAPAWTWYPTSAGVYHVPSLDMSLNTAAAQPTVVTLSI